MDPLALSDPLNFCVARLRLTYQDTELGYATGFFLNVVEGDNPPVLYLVTNWHVVTGRSAIAPYTALHPKGGLPDNIHARLILKNPPPGHANKIVRVDVTIPIYDNNGDALWYQHPNGSAVDIAAMSLGQSAVDYRVAGINGVANTHDMAIRIANDVYILGYPLGLTHFLETPLWKHGSIASEPHTEEDGQAPRIAIDATTRGGMSGSPVIMRASTHYLSENGEVKCAPGASRFIGVYASRPDLTTSDKYEKAEIGYVYKSGALDQLIKAQLRGLRFGALPETGPNYSQTAP